MAKELQLSIVVPTYNEEKIIGETLKKVTSYLKVKKYVWEVVVADDGSTDKTTELVRHFADENKRVKLVKLTTNRGKGAVLRKGILASYGEYIIFMDADLSVPLKNIDVFMNKFGVGESVVIASRRVRGARIVVHQPWYREIMGRVFTFLTKIFMGVPLADFTCGFKGFRKTAARKIFSNSLVDRWAYDAEIMFLAKKYGYKIVEIPVKWENREETRVRLKTVIGETFRDLVKIRLNDMLGKY